MNYIEWKEKFFKLPIEVQVDIVDKFVDFEYGEHLFIMNKDVFKAFFNKQTDAEIKQNYFGDRKNDQFFMTDSNGENAYGIMDTKALYELFEEYHYLEKIYKEHRYWVIQFADYYQFNVDDIEPLQVTKADRVKSLLKELMELGVKVKIDYQNQLGWFDITVDSNSNIVLKWNGKDLDARD